MTSLNCSDLSFYGNTVISPVDTDFAGAGILIFSGTATLRTDYPEFQKPPEIYLRNCRNEHVS